MRGSAMPLVMLLAAAIGLQAGEAEVEAKRKAALEQLLRVLPKSEPFERWIEATGELPPDFDVLPRIPGLPDPLVGAGGACTYRDFSEAQFGEGIERITRLFPDWLHPRLRFFAGRGDRLPIDQHGTHETLAKDIEIYLDWLDAAFERGGPAFPEVLLWPLREGERGSGFARARPDGAPRILRARLGTEPPSGANPGGTYGAERTWRAAQLGRGDVPSGVKRRSIAFGDYIAADVYYPEKAEGGAARIPACIWVHPISRSNGYVAGYRRGESVHTALARRGFAAGGEVALHAAAEKRIAGAAIVSGLGGVDAEVQRPAFDALAKMAGP